MAMTMVTCASRAVPHVRRSRARERAVGGRHAGGRIRGGGPGRGPTNRLQACDHGHRGHAHASSRPSVGRGPRRGGCHLPARRPGGRARRIRPPRRERSTAGAHASPRRPRSRDYVCRVVAWSPVRQGTGCRHRRVGQRLVNRRGGCGNPSEGGALRHHGSPSERHRPPRLFRSRTRLRGPRPRDRQREDRKGRTLPSRPAGALRDRAPAGQRRGSVRGGEARAHGHLFRRTGYSGRGGPAAAQRLDRGARRGRGRDAGRGLREALPIRRIPEPSSRGGGRALPNRRSPRSGLPVCRALQRGRRDRDDGH